MGRYAFSKKLFIELGTVGIIGEGENDLPNDVEKIQLNQFNECTLSGTKGFNQVNNMFV